MRNGNVSEHLNKKRDYSYSSVSRTAYPKDVQRERQKLVILMVCVPWSSSLHGMWSSQCACVPAVLDQIQDEWEPCTSPDVRPLIPDKELVI